jgi:hypothetical protein
MVLRITQKYSKAFNIHLLIGMNGILFTVKGLNLTFAAQKWVVVKT